MLCQIWNKRWSPTFNDYSHQKWNKWNVVLYHETLNKLADNFTFWTKSNVEVEIEGPHFFNEEPGVTDAAQDGMSLQSVLKHRL